MPSALLFILFSPLQCYCSLFLCVCVLTVVANTVKFPAWTSPGCSQLTNALTSKLEEEKKLKKKMFRILRGRQRPLLRFLLDDEHNVMSVCSSDWLAVWLN